MRRGRSMVVAIALAIVVAGCATGTPPAHGIDPSTGFPRGVFRKETTDPEVGHIRIEWVFGDDGRWAELPIPLDGQPQKGAVVRGTYAVDGDLVTIATDWPPGWGTSTHQWRMDGDALWTAFVSSDVDGDAEYFESIDSQPWRPVP